MTVSDRPKINVCVVNNLNWDWYTVGLNFNYVSFVIQTTAMRIEQCVTFNGKQSAIVMSTTSMIIA